MKKILSIITLLLVTNSVFAQSKLPDLKVVFGYTGTTYPLHLEDNDTAVTIARYVGTRSWNLPIAGFEGFENSDVMNYYDIPSSYRIPSDPKVVTSEKAGEVYYSYPNRLILFYHDANVRGEFTKVGIFDVTRNFIKDVEENPVLDGWGVMIINVEK